MVKLSLYFDYLYSLFFKLFNTTQTYLYAIIKVNQCLPIRQKLICNNKNIIWPNYSSIIIINAIIFSSILSKNSSNKIQLTILLLIYIYILNIIIIKQ